jgi:hypothetical protein
MELSKHHGVLGQAARTRQEDAHGGGLFLDTQRTGCAAFGEHRSPPIEWTSAKEYLDDGIAGDDFLGRAGLRQLMEDLKPGDVVVCRDHSRLGRDAIEVTLVARQIVSLSLRPGWFLHYRMATPGSVERFGSTRKMPHLRRILQEASPVPRLALVA